jgi:hypothetical protein
MRSSARWITLGAACSAVLITSHPARAEWTNATGDVGGDKWGYAGVCLGRIRWRR